MELNPYLTGRIVRDADRFVGRKTILQTVTKELANDKIVLLYGQRRVGKSSVLFRIESELIKFDKNGFIPIYYSLEGQLDKPIEELLGNSKHNKWGLRIKRGKTGARHYFCR